MLWRILKRVSKNKLTVVDIIIGDVTWMDLQVLHTNLLQIAILRKKRMPINMDIISIWAFLVASEIVSRRLGKVKVVKGSDSIWRNYVRTVRNKLMVEDICIIIGSAIWTDLEVPDTIVIVYAWKKCANMPISMIIPYICRLWSAQEIAECLDPKEKVS